MDTFLKKRITLTQDMTLREAALHLEDNDLDRDGRMVLYVINMDNQLIGSIMDIDIRRAITRGELSLDTKVTQIMNTNPRKIIKGEVVHPEDYKIWKRFQYIPIVDQQGNLLGFKENHEIYNLPNKVIIMAGGLGTRLRPLTDDTPKPMLKLAGKPILQEIIESFKARGFLTFLISVNYKSHIIKDYFQDGKSFGVKIIYLEEENRLGTCGSIKLAEQFLKEPFFVINGDILADVDHEKLLQYHLHEKNVITLCTFPYHNTIPYGVIETQNQKISILEKPTYTHYINCGIYVLNPSIFTLMNENQPLDMPNLIQHAINQGFQIGTFMINEWIDIGNLEDFYRAQTKINPSKE